jgi:AraC family transcriptional regulator, regulatory protein of adaptative response / DNA-3-methyladenine glycosylase II
MRRGGGAREGPRTVVTVADMFGSGWPQASTRSPSAIPARVDAPNELSVRLPFRPPFAADILLSFLSARAVAGVEEVRDRTYRRSVRTSEGASVIALSPDEAAGHVTLELSIDLAADPTTFVHGARRAFDLDADPLAIDAKLAGDPKLAPLVARMPGMRVPGTFDPFELLVRAIFGQQISVSGARTSLSRFAARFGTPLDQPSGSITHLFPTAEQVAELPPEAVGVPRERAMTIRRVAELVAQDQLDLSAGARNEETLHILGDIRGIGPWTISYVAMRALRDPDAFMSSDLGVRKGFETLGLPSTERAILDRAERWRPWRAYAAMHLWHAHP